MDAYRCPECLTPLVEFSLTPKAPTWMCPNHPQYLHGYYDDRQVLAQAMQDYCGTTNERKFVFACEDAARKEGEE